MCETLEKRLLNISLSNLNPPVKLSILDIDSNVVSVDIKTKYTNEVPVLVLDSSKLLKKVELPRVSPRIKEDILLSWIQKKLNDFYKID